MNSHHRKTLERIYEKPVLSNIRWQDVISLLKACGATIDDLRSGSRVGIELNGVIAVFHKPHPGNEMKRGAVESMRNFLMKAGIMP